MKDVNQQELNNAIEKKDFSTLYNIFEDLYNPYPVQMSRSDAFNHARNDGLITDELYKEAAAYYKTLWYYVGD